MAYACRRAPCLGIAAARAVRLQGKRRGGLLSVTAWLVQAPSSLTQVRVQFASTHCLASVLTLQYYECLPNDAIEDLRHERDFECPKASQVWGSHSQNKAPI